MKKLLMGSIVVSLALSGCSKESVGEKEVTKVEDTQEKKKRVGKSKDHK